MLVAGYVCTDAAAHGHLERWAASSSSNRPEKKRAADMTDDEREAAKAKRRNVIESNNAWKAATMVRRDWLTNTFAHRKTAPAGAEAYLARVVTDGWGHERATSDALSLAGFPARENVDPWTAAAEQRQAVTDALAAATPKRSLPIGLAVAVAMWETRTHPNTWRAADEQTVLTRLDAALGSLRGGAPARGAERPGAGNRPGRAAKPRECAAESAGQASTAAHSPSPAWATGSTGRKSANGLVRNQFSNWLVSRGGPIRSTRPCRMAAR